MMFCKVFFQLALSSLFFLPLAAAAQSKTAPVTDVTSELLDWVKHLNNDLDKYFKKEKGAQLNEALDFLKQDLTVYLKTRKALSDSLFRHNAAPGKRDEQNLEVLKAKMSDIMGRMRNVTDLTNKELREEGDKLNDQIYNVLFGDKTHFLSHLEAFLAGMDVTKKDLALDGSTYFTRLQECINLISTLQGRINKKM
jgi:hypothetical protein